MLRSMLCAAAGLLVLAAPGYTHYADAGTPDPLVVDLMALRADLQKSAGVVEPKAKAVVISVGYGGIPPITDEKEISVYLEPGEVWRFEKIEREETSGKPGPAHVDRRRLTAREVRMLKALLSNPMLYREPTAQPARCTDQGRTGDFVDFNGRRRNFFTAGCPLGVTGKLEFLLDSLP